MPKVPYRVAFVSHTTQLSGAAMSYYTLLTGLDRQEFQCLPVLPDKGPLYQRLHKKQYSPFEIPFTGFQKLGSVAKAMRFLQANKVDLVYLSCAQKFCRMVGKAANKLDISVVWHVREPPLGHRVQKNIPYMRRFNASVVVVSREQERALSSKLKVSRIDNGVDLDRFDCSIDGSHVRGEYGLNTTDFVFGIIGAVERRKNTEHFLLAAKKLTDAHENIKFLVVGDGKEDYIEKMKSIVNAHPKLKRAVTFTGNIWDVPAIMSVLDVLVMPSTWEAFPRVVIEGMAMKKIIIASDVGDVNYIIDHGENGFVVPVSDFKALTDMMTYVFQNRTQLTRIAESAHEKAMHSFTQKTHVNNMTLIFKQALSLP